MSSRIEGSNKVAMHVDDELLVARFRGETCSCCRRRWFRVELCVGLVQWVDGGRSDGPRQVDLRLSLSSKERTPSIGRQVDFDR